MLCLQIFLKDMDRGCKTQTFTNRNPSVSWEMGYRKYTKRNKSKIGQLRVKKYENKSHL